MTLSAWSFVACCCLSGNPLRHPKTWTMINLRYHIVSLTAMFLALGIGVLLGGTYLDKYTVDQLDQNIKSAEIRIRETRAENDRLRGQMGDATARDQALIEAGVPQLFTDRLTDVPVLIIASDSIDETSRQNVIRSVASTGADFRGTLTITDRFDLDNDRYQAVADALGIDAKTPVAIRRAVVAKFALALSVAGEPAPTANGEGPSGTTPGTDPSTTTVVPPTTVAPSIPPDDTSTTEVPRETTTTTSPPPLTQPDVITVLLSQGMLAFEGPQSAPAPGPLLSGTGYRYVFLSGPKPAVADSLVILPTLRVLSESGSAPAVVASAPVGDDLSETRNVVIGRVLADSVLNRAVSTVDNLETFNGLAATVLALDEVGDGIHGHYGVGRGATAQLPGGS
ncbi:MAG: copper transporter [Aquihabitans sp.]